jgi:hypothetical protein
VYNAIAIEDFGKPVVALTNQGFIIDSASGKGMPGVRVVREHILSDSTREEIEAGISAVMDDIIAALTSPLTAEEKSPKKKEVEKPSRIIFQGNLAEVNRFFYQRGWSDGLPIIPPTEEAVAEMLTGTDLPADHVVAKIIPRLGKATVEKIAINAVMAGALPTYMPVLIAGVQALMEPVTRFDTFQDSQGSWAPFWIINGPIRHDIRVNCGVGALSPGDIANAAIGRAMGLIVKNIGGVRKGVEDMGALGNPGKYTMVLGEYEEESPWEPLHVERGFKKEDSTLTVFFPRIFNQARGTGTRGILNAMASNLQGAGLASFVLVPMLAKIVAGEGWTKNKVKEFISENASVPLPRNVPVSGSQSASQRQAPTTPRMKPNPDGFLIVVAGGPDSFIHIQLGSRIVPWQNFVTKKVELPTNWGKLVAKYKGIVPTYAKY